MPLVVAATLKGNNYGKKWSEGRPPPGRDPGPDAVPAPERALRQAGHQNRRDHQREGGPQAVQGHRQGEASTCLAAGTTCCPAPWRPARHAAADPGAASLATPESE